jgi:hypothetical protein
MLYWIQVGTIGWLRKTSYTNLFQISNDNSRHVWASIVIHKKKIPHEVLHIPGCTYVPSLRRFQQIPNQCGPLKTYQPRSLYCLHYIQYKSTFFHSLSSQFTYWCANSSRALRCSTVNLGPVAGVFANKPLSFSLLRTVETEIITPRTSADRPARIVDGNPLSRNTERHKNGHIDQLLTCYDQIRAL